MKAQDQRHRQDASMSSEVVNSTHHVSKLDISQNAPL